MIKVKSGDFIKITLEDGSSQYHPTTVLSVRGKNVLLCGHTWCSGACGLPQARTPSGQRVSGSMTACGPVLQDPRCKWNGEVFLLQQEEAESLSGRWWL